MHTSLICLNRSATVLLTAFLPQVERQLMNQSLGRKKDFVGNKNGDPGFLQATGHIYEQ